MCRRRAAATANYIDAQIAREVLQLFRQRFGRLFEYGVSADVFGDARIGNHGYGARPVLTNVTNVFGHLLWARGAIHANNIDRKRFQGAAPISVPISIVPKASMVTCAMTGTRRFDDSNSSKMAASAAFVCKRS